MKPKIDINHPAVKYAMQYMEVQVNIALDAPRTVEDAVIPIYAIPKTKAHEKPKTKAEQIGSGVLVKIEDHYFIFSATHVFMDFAEYVLLTGTGGGDPIIPLPGERYSTGNKCDYKPDVYDASIYHIDDDIPDSLKKIAITTDDFDLSDTEPNPPVFMAIGYRVKKSNIIGNQIYSKRECFPTGEYGNDQYQQFGIDPNSQIALAYDNQVLSNGNWIISPTPRGISGGAIVKVEGTELIHPEKVKSIPSRQLLTAITIEQHREKSNKPGLLIGTRIKVHLGLVYQFMPNLLKRFLSEYEEKINKF